MMFGWPSVRHMRRGLPNSQIVLLEKFYYDYLKVMGLLKEKDPDEDDDWDDERLTGDPT